MHEMERKRYLLRERNDKLVKDAIIKISKKKKKCQKMQHFFNYFGLELLNQRK